ncbi:MAK10-like protein [Tanacetum coccineum]|uniref:MAK10-like protein n=1 Tax=Tanacetum coccineum TaxID=301880 RepID=A0ABQ5J6Z8_9ASTR
MPTKMKDPRLFTLPCRLGDSKPFDTLADLGSCVNIIPLYLFKKLKIGLLEETNHVFGLGETKSYHVGIVRDVEVHIGKLKLMNDFYVIDMKKDPETPLLVGRGFLATANAVIDCRKAKIAVEEGITKEWEIARDAEINPFKDVLVFRRMVIFDKEKPGSRKAYLLEDKEIPSVGVHHDPDAPVLIDCEIDGQMVKITSNQLGAVLDKQEKMKMAEMSTSEITKVVTEVVIEASVKISGTKEFIQHQPVTVTMYRNNDVRDFEVLGEFKFSDFTIRKKYERLKEIAKTLKIDESLPLPEKNPSLPSNKKRKAIELELETYIAGLECNRKLPKGVNFVLNKVIKEPEYGLFFIDAFGDETFQRVSDVHKVKNETLVGYKLMAFNNKSASNLKFMALVDQMIF